MMRTTVAVVVLLIVGCSDPGARTAEEAANVASIEAETTAFNAKEPGLVERFYSEDLIYHSYGPWAPQGMPGDRESLEQGVAAGMRMFPDRGSQ